MILTRKADIPTSGGASAHVEYHTGLSAQFWGVLFLIFSVPIGAFGIFLLGRCSRKRANCGLVELRGPAS